MKWRTELPLPYPKKKHHKFQDKELCILELPLQHYAVVLQAIQGITVYDARFCFTYKEALEEYNKQKQELIKK